jgi:arylsulfatase A-like enzyme
VAFSGDTAYYEYSLNHDGQVVHHGSDPSDYSTDVLAGEADRFIRSTPDTQPLLLYFTPWAPHAPATPAPRHDDVLTDLEPWRPPSFNEPDVSDKPAYIRDLPLLDPYKQGTIDRLRPDMYRSLLAVDDAVGTIVAALEDEGRLDTTMIVFLSDNGFLWGEHRWPAKWGKSVPYEESIRIPFVVRYDPMTEPGRRIARLVANVDIAPTLARLAGVAAPGAEGRSLLRLIDGRVRDWRPAVLIEYLRRWSPTPTYCGIRTRSHLYVFYEPAEEELYALRHDPYQLTDRADDPSLSGLVSRLRAMLAELCDPPPPGLTLPTP